MRIARILSHSLRAWSATKSKYLIVSIVIVGSMGLIAAVTFPRGRGARQTSGLLIARQSALTWESPNANGPIVAEYAELHFLLDNPGRQPVKVLRIDTTCGCVKPVADPPEVQPGGMTTIVAKAITPSTGTRIVPLVVHTDSPVKPAIRLTAKIIVRRKPPFLYDVTGDLNFRGTFSPELACDFLVITFESGGPTAEPEITTDVPFLKIERAEVSDEPAGSRAESTVGRPVIVRTRRYRVGFKEPPLDPDFTGTITVTDPFRRAGSRSLNVLGQLRDRSETLTVMPRALTLGKQKGASGSILVVCETPSRTVECAIDESRRADFSINTDSDSSSRRVHKIEVVVVDPMHMADDPVRLKVRDSRTGAVATVLVRLTRETTGDQGRQP